MRDGVGVTAYGAVFVCVCVCVVTAPGLWMKWTSLSVTFTRKMETRREEEFTGAS